MRIHDVEFLGLRSPLDQPAVFSWGSADARNVGLIRVTTESGLDGVGETSVTFPLWSLEERALTVREGLRPLVIGHDASDIGGLTALLRRTLGRLAPLWSPVGIAAAIGAFEMALWDIRGKAQDTPLYQLLNPAVREPTPINLYAVGFGGPPERIADGVAAALADGYPAVKVRVGFGRDHDLAMLKAVQLAVGPDHMAQVLVDVNMAWDRETAREMVPAVAAFGVGWLEEPLVHDDVAGLVDLRASAGVPIAAGENAYTPEAGVNLVKAGAVDVLMPDIARCGGLLAAQTMVHAAQAADIPYSPHQYASEIGFIAGLHLCAAEPGANYLLRDLSPWPLRHEVITEAPVVVGGRAWVPSGSGLGVTLDPAAVERYRVV